LRGASLEVAVCAEVTQPDMGSLAKHFDMLAKMQALELHRTWLIEPLRSYPETELCVAESAV
jgi:hypothetical protein